MFSFLKSDQPVIDDDAREWMFDVYAWALRQFDSEFFFNHSQLVLPNNSFFPGRATSEQEMAELIFSQVCRYAGIAHWPTAVVSNQLCQLQGDERVQINGRLRSSTSEAPLVDVATPRLQIPYNPVQLNNPEGLIASFAHVIAHYLGQFAKEPPPGGTDNWPHTTEMIAIFLGFGLMFANSAYTFRGGCGSCYNPAANRDAFLTERQSTYALAIFAVLKGIPEKQVTRELKSHLRGFYRRALREIRQQPGLPNLLQPAQLAAQ
jgi:hypothetical protein